MNENKINVVLDEKVIKLLKRGHYLKTASSVAIGYILAALIARGLGIL